MGTKRPVPDDDAARLKPRLIRAFERCAGGDAARIEALVAGWGFKSFQDIGTLRKRHFDSLNHDGSAGCLVDGCDSEVTDCHMVQANSLRHIARKGQLIEFVLPRTPEDSRGIFAREIGVSKFSTFPGYCNAHDNGLFRVIDSWRADEEPPPDVVLRWHARCAAASHLVNRRRAAIQLDLACMAVAHTADAAFRRAALYAAYGTWRTVRALEVELQRALRGEHDQFFLGSCCMAVTPFAGATFSTIERTASGAEIAAEDRVSPPAMTLAVIPGGTATRLYFAGSNRFRRVLEEEWAHIEALVVARDPVGLLKHAVWRSLRVGLDPVWWYAQAETTQSEIVAAATRGMEDHVLFRLEQSGLARTSE